MPREVYTDRVDLELIIVVKECVTKELVKEKGIDLRVYGSLEFDQTTADNYVRVGSANV